jgi:tetratricopeptide (TPR) repeat protein
MMAGIKTVSRKIAYAVGRYILIATIFFVLLETVLRVFSPADNLALLQRQTMNGEDFFTVRADYLEQYFERQGTPALQPLWVRAEKPAGVKRVVVLGESAAAGYPMMGYNLARIMQVLWRDRFPDHPVEIINLAVVAVNSHVMRRFAEEAIALDPDVILLYAGHNEVIGPYGPASRFGSFRGTGGLAQGIDLLLRTRTGQWLNQWARQIVSRTNSGEPGIWLGLDEFVESTFAYDDPALDRMLRSVRRNITSIIDTALTAGAEVVLCVPAVNLNDWPPLVSEAPHPSIAEVWAAQESGKAADIRSAHSLYRAAKARERAGDMLRAWPLYRLAGDRDQQRIRADSRIRELFRELAFQYPQGVQVVDVDRWLHEEHPRFDGDRVFFLEHVHLTFIGRVAVAALAIDGLARLWQMPDSGLNAEAWWDELPAWEQSARIQTLFTALDEADMWAKIADLLTMRVFESLADRPERIREYGRLVRELFEVADQERKSDRLPDLYAEAARLNPEDALLHFTAGRLFAMRGDYARGRAAFERGLALQPNHTIGRLNLARLFVRTGEPALARGQITELWGFNPEARGVEWVEASISLAEGDRQRAIGDLERHLQRFPGDREAREQLELLQKNLVLELDPAGD